MVHQSQILTWTHICQIHTALYQRGVWLLILQQNSCSHCSTCWNNGMITENLWEQLKMGRTKAHAPGYAMESLKVWAVRHGLAPDRLSTMHGPSLLSSLHSWALESHLSRFSSNKKTEPTTLSRQKQIFSLLLFLLQGKSCSEDILSDRKIKQAVDMNTVISLWCLNKPFA